MPSCVVRLYLPHPDIWENRTGPHFGMRLGVRTTAQKPRQGLFSIGTSLQNEPYWPGIWVHFRSKTSPGIDQDSVLLKVRANALGHDFPVKKIPAEKFGWWTFGMSVSPDGRIHYFARQGVDDLTPSDLMVSQKPYGYEAERVTSFFFNIAIETMAELGPPRLRLMIRNSLSWIQHASIRLLNGKFNIKCGKHRLRLRPLVRQASRVSSH